ncbi:Transcriptional activator of proteases prtT [Penicillium cosmopolitanum]|uniref:Transcriptional activator of proteases prtT n=1 Tax=Penicillium cosmopolitanum TaxID=1131564 RepID=A0A9W9VRR7_9EURO|nr:Transcriptional activator of proteases prtT [Penicillium cosmopolitanum]KAJ5388151.1 Transcriptional activator of proteases prtT [Penicillium cosmopolitanum]
MTRTEPTCSAASWETKSIATTDDGNRMDSVGQDSRPRGRIRRSMTACNTCRKLKTRCDLDPRGHACRRCLSLRLECELPETPDRFQDQASAWPDSNGAIPSIEERLLHLEHGMGEMIHLMRQMVNNTSNLAGSPRPQATRSLDESTSGEIGALPPFTIKPVQFIRDLQLECFSGRDGLTGDADIIGDVVSLGIIDIKLSYKLMELFVEYYSSWMATDPASSIQRSDTLLFNTACLLASRYLPGMPEATIHNISLQVQNAITQAMWGKSSLSNDVLQALALLCHKEGFVDGWLLSGTSMNHALISFGFLNVSHSKSALTDEMLSQMRLWNMFCLTHLHYAFGYGRTLNVQLHYLDHCIRILDHHRATPEDGRIVAEIQLYRIALKLQSSPHRLRFAETEYEEIERWKMEWTHLFSNEGKSALELSVWFCQLILHRTAIRLHSESDQLISETCNNARLIISRSLQTRFSAAPGLIDNVYYILGYAALTLCDYSPSDPLIDQVRAFLLHLSPSSDHLAYRIACIIGEVQRRYSEAATADQTSPSASNALFVASQAPRTENIDIGQLIPTGGSMDGIVDGYGCYDQLIASGYVPPQQAFSAPAVFQHPAPVTGGAMPISLVPRALHDY